MISDKILAKIFIVGILIAFSSCTVAIFHIFPKFVYMWEVAGVGWVMAFVAIVLRFMRGNDNDDV